MKILHILHSGLGGSASVVFSLLKENDQKSFNQHSTLFTGDSLFKNYKKKSKKLLSPSYFIKTKKYLPWLQWLNVFIKLCRIKPDLIILHNFQHIPVLFYKLLFKKKVIFVDHQSEFFLKYKTLIASLISLIFFNHIIFVNKKKKLNFKKKFKLFKKKISFIPNSVDVDYFNSVSNEIKSKFYKVGMAARVDNGKKQELIIKSLNLPKLKNLKIIFSIAGDGENIKNLKRIVKKNNLEKKVNFEGSLNEDQIKSWYRKLNLYIHASKGEAMSISILEAMSMRVPVIASNVIGINNLLDEKSKIGILFNNTELDLSKKIHYFYHCSNFKINQFKNSQRNFVKNKFSSLKMYAKYNRVIFKILNKRKV
jgi:glycosyltransferase involved in cell wall biosynthesis